MQQLDLFRDTLIPAEPCLSGEALQPVVAVEAIEEEDLRRPVLMAAACALGLMGRNEVRPLLTRYLREEPSAPVIDAIVPVADEECIVLLGRIARAMPDLSHASLDALDAIDHPRALKIIAEIGPNSVFPLATGNS